MYDIKLDFDGRLPRRLLDNVRALFRWVGGRPAAVALWRTRHGWHVLVKSRAAWLRDDLALVAAQAVLGSDAKREMFNLMRVVRLDRSTPLQRRRRRWNVFYRRKLKG